jgi:apolipoprotein N-acyltransferase
MPKPHPLPVRALLVLASVALLWLALPPVGLAPLALVAVAPFLIALQGLTPREGLRVGFVFGYLSAVANAHWFVNVFPWTFALVLWGIVGLFPTIYGLLHAWLARRSATLLVVTAPALWIALDWFRSEVGPLKFAWFTLGHALGGNEWLRQNADLAGVYGLTLFAFATCLAIERAVAYRNDGRAFVIALVTVAANLAFLARGNRVVGFASTEETRALRVLAVQDESFDDLEPKRRKTLEAARTFPPDVILWPEDSFFSDYEKNAGWRLGLAEVAAVASHAFVFGSARDVPGEKRPHNAAILLDPSGKRIGEYWKRVPVQFVEDAIPGTESPLFDMGGTRVGVMICYDGTYPFVTRDLARAGAEVLLVPTMDVAAWGPVQHAHHALFYALRACEVRKPIVRAASSGFTFALDAWGRRVGGISPFLTGTLGVTVHPNDLTTPYTEVGWLLPMLASAVALVGLGAASRRPVSS